MEFAVKMQNIPIFRYNIYYYLEIGTINIIKK